MGILKSSKKLANPVRFHLFCKTAEAVNRTRKLDQGEPSRGFQSAYLMADGVLLVTLPYIPIDICVTIMYLKLNSIFFLLDTKKRHVVSFVELFLMSN